MAVVAIALGTGTGGVGTSLVTVNTQLTFNNAAEALAYEHRNANSPCYVQEVALVNTGVNDAVPPTKAGGVIITPPLEATYSASLADSGNNAVVTLSKTGVAFIPFPVAAPAHFYLKWTGPDHIAEAVTADLTTDKITLNSHGFENGDRVKIDPTSTTCPGGLNTATWYYVVNKATNDFQLALTASGSVVDITSNGSSVKVTAACTFKLVWI